MEVQQLVLDRVPTTVDQTAQNADTHSPNRLPYRKGPSLQGSASRKEQHTRGTAQHAKSSESPLFGGASANKDPGASCRCFPCTQVGHVRVACPEQKEPSPPVQPVVMFVSVKTESLSHHMQLVIVGGKVTRELKNSGAYFSLVHPEIINTGDIIPEKTLSVKGVGRNHPKMHVTKGYWDWGVGRGLREVGVSNEIPVNVLLGNDLGCMVTTFVPYDQVSLGPAALECDHSPQSVTATGKVQRDSWEGGLEDRRECPTVPEPAVSQSGGKEGEGEERFPLGVPLVQRGRLPAVRDKQRGIPDLVPQLPEVLSGGQQIGQSQESVQECGGQVVRTQSRVPVGSATQTGVKDGSWEPGRAPVPEPVLGEGLVVRVQEGLLMVLVAPKAATNQRVCPEVQGMWVEPSSLCRSGTEQVSTDQVVGIDWVEGCQTVSEFRPRKWGTRDR
ncbi:uncharacterized protein LOC116411465 [Xenopus tropicalis]|uniref:Uncharacterized LOC116411465 n=1 Tax=Xenopus tropicalis TaxID=8364 RepID=A0A803J5T0_XENTR|nr:uncharacterized protein LOC116411465 [Xenopus tropicalis]